MNRIAGTALGLLLTVSPALAQLPGGIGGLSPRPAVSPYLNLLRPGNSPGVNYYGLVRPQVQATNSVLGLQQQNLNLQQQVTNNQSAIAGIVNPNLPATGHQAMFLNTGGYFLNMNAGMMGGGGGGSGMSGGPFGGAGRVGGGNRPAQQSSSPRR